MWGLKSDRNRINKFLKKRQHPSLVYLLTEVVMEKRVCRKLSSILINKDHPLYSVFSELKNSFRARLVMPRCSSERFRRSFIPGAVRFFNEHCC